MPRFPAASTGDSSSPSDVFASPLSNHPQWSAAWMGAALGPGSFAARLTSRKLRLTEDGARYKSHGPFLIDRLYWSEVSTVPLGSGVQLALSVASST
jgi:hypothetical protein